MYLKKLDNSNINSSLIVIFLGWGMDEKPFADLHKDGYDIALLWGQADANTPEMYSNLISGYKQVVVIAWSYGVATANSLISDRESLRIAVNGTYTPANNTTGIPKHVFAATLRSVSEQNMRKFFSAVAGISPLRKHFMSNLPNRDIEELKSDLQQFGEMENTVPNAMWDKVYIADNDAIIPPANQENAWQGFYAVHTQSSHLPDLQSIIDTDIIDKNIIAKRFAESSGGYESEAEVQKGIAQTLYGFWLKFQNNLNGDLLEIGIGTGFLTRLYAKHYDAEKCMLVDLAPLENIRKIAEKFCLNGAKCVSGDAEQFLAEAQDSSFDTILSSSTIQWFASPRRFFANVARTLKSGGTAAISTFEPGTFEEISSITGKSLNYYTAEQFEAMLPENLELVFAHKDTATIAFKGGRQLLKHIQNTGVNALGGSPMTYADTVALIKKLDENPCLTYKNVYLIIKKK